MSTKGTTMNTNDLPYYAIIGSVETTFAFPKIPLTKETSTWLFEVVQDIRAEDRNSGGTSIANGVVLHHFSFRAMQMELLKTINKNFLVNPDDKEEPAKETPVFDKISKMIQEMVNLSSEQRAQRKELLETIQHQIEVVLNPGVDDEADLVITVPGIESYEPQPEKNTPEDMKNAIKQTVEYIKNLFPEEENWTQVGNFSGDGGSIYGMGKKFELLATPREDHVAPILKACLGYFCKLENPEAELAVRVECPEGASSLLDKKVMGFIRGLTDIGIKIYTSESKSIRAILKVDISGDAHGEATFLFFPQGMEPERPGTLPTIPRLIFRQWCHHPFTVVVAHR